jgi:hypothetical protein
MKFYSIITNKNIKEKLIDFIKNKDLISIGGSKEILNSGQAVGFLSNINLSKVNLSKSFEDAVSLTFDLDEDCEKHIILISDNFDNNLKYNIQKNLDLEKKSNLFDNFCNFYFVTSEEISFDHPKIFYLKNFDEIEEKQ